MTKVDSKSRHECCGCTACESVCPRQAITMSADHLGFLFPKISEDACINCGLCNKVCNFVSNYKRPTPLNEPITFAGRLKDAQNLKKSQSGGLFAVLSDALLEQGGVVYGAGYTEHFRVVHKRANNKEERDELRKSKYVQSDMRGVMSAVKKDLKDGRMVLFSGTACQCAGLHSYIAKKLQQNLILLDIICHGVPAPNIWRDYLEWSEKRYKGKVTDVLFRDKVGFGWRSCVEALKINEKWRHSKAYTFLFFEKYMIRESCHSCHFCNTNRPSDITIGDMWGMPEEISSMVADNKGCSYIQINTEKGKQLFSACKEQLQLLQFPFGRYTQHNLQASTTPSRLRNHFIRDYENQGFEFVLKKYGNVTWKRKLRLWLQRYGILSFSNKVVGKIRCEWRKLLRRQA